MAAPPPRAGDRSKCLRFANAVGCGLTRAGVPVRVCFPPNWFATIPKRVRRDLGRARGSRTRWGAKKDWVPNDQIARVKRFRFRLLGQKQPLVSNLLVLLLD